jgi:hypothetical protein
VKDYGPHFRKLAERVLPEDSRILTPSGAPDLILLATWRLRSDPARPQKRSRMIRIVIAEEALEDYARGIDGARLVSDDRFVQWLRTQMSEFDPNHDSPLGVEPQAVKWLIGTVALNG